MENQSSSVDKVVTTWWATVWYAILGSWPALASATPLKSRQQDDSSLMSSQQEQPMGTTSQGLIAGLSAGAAVLVLTGIALIVCYPRRRKRARGRSNRPVNPWIQQTTTTTVTSHSRSGSFESTDSLTKTAAPLPMTRITNIDKRGRYIVSKEAAVDAERDVAGPSSGRPPASLQRYSVHVTSNGNGATSSKAGGTLAPLTEESGTPARLLTSEAIMPLPSWSGHIPTDVSSASTSPSTPGRSGIADRRGRPALQSIHVPSPSSLATVKGKGKARLYYH